MLEVNWTRREILLTITTIILTILCIILAFKNKDTTKNLNLEKYENVLAKKKTQTDKEEQEDKKKKKIFVDVKGQVTNPGIYEIDENTRLFQVIKKAGGTTNLADLNRLNLAQKVSDGIVIYIPKKGEKTEINLNNNLIANTSAEKININTASATQLEELNGIGKVKANAIVEYREKHGPFKNIEDLKKVKGLGEKTIEKFKNQITF